MDRSVDAEHRRPVLVVVLVALIVLAGRTRGGVIGSSGFSVSPFGRPVQFQLHRRLSSSWQLRPVRLFLSGSRFAYLATSPFRDLVFSQVARFRAFHAGWSVLDGWKGRAEPDERARLQLGLLTDGKSTPSEARFVMRTGDLLGPVDGFDDVRRARRTRRSIQREEPAIEHQEMEHPVWAKN